MASAPAGFPARTRKARARSTGAGYTGDDRVVYSSSLWEPMITSPACRRALPGCAVPCGRLAFFILLFHVPAAAAQYSAARASLELHAGYGGGGTHSDGLIGGGLSYSFGATVEGTTFLTAVIARPEGRAVFGGAGVRLTLLHGAVRPYLAGGPLLAMRSYAQDQLGGFASLGLAAAIAGPDQRWWAFMEGRAMRGGGSWTQLVGGLRLTIR